MTGFEVASVSTGASPAGELRMVVAAPDSTSATTGSGHV
jgi:hypothetical protein